MSTTPLAQLISDPPPDSKIEIVADAYSQLRISGLTVDPEPEDVELALRRLETMMADYAEARNICIGYNFEAVPNPGTPTGVSWSHKHMMATNLAVRLIPDFNKAVPQTLLDQASAAFSDTSAIAARQTTQQVNYPRRMPRGGANSLRLNRWQRYFREEQLPPNECATKTLIRGEIEDFQESFLAYLGAEDIQSVTTQLSPGISLVSISNNAKVVSYRIQAVDNATTGSYQQMSLTITTSTGRIENRLINFLIQDYRIRS